MKREQKQPEHVKPRYKIILETIDHHRIDIIMAERIRFKQSEPCIRHTNGEMRQMTDNKGQHDQAAHHQVARGESCFHIAPVDVGFRPGAAILNRQMDRYPDVNNDRRKQEQTNCPKQGAEIAQMLRVTIDPVWSDKNLQIAEQMSDDKKDQNDASDRDDHFFSDG